MYRVPKIQLSIQGIWSNTSFIKVEGQNDEVDVKKSPLFSILKVKEIEDQLLCFYAREKKSKVIGGSA